MSKNERGFTLIELLVAMVITVLLVGALFNVFNLAGRAWQKGEARTQRYQNLRQALNRMSEEIRGAILLSATNNPAPKDLRFYGCANRNSPGETGEELNFISVSHPPDGWDYGSQPGALRFDCCEISYYITGSGEERKLIRRWQKKGVPDDNVTTSGPGTARSLAERITHLNFSYYDEKNVYSDLWNSSTKLPTKVRIELTAQARHVRTGEVMLREQKEEIFTTEVWLANANFQ